MHTEVGRRDASGIDRQGASYQQTTYPRCWYNYPFRAGCWAKGYRSAEAQFATGCYCSRQIAQPFVSALTESSLWNGKYSHAIIDPIVLKLGAEYN